MRPIPPLALALGLLAPTAHAAEPASREELRWDRPVLCLRDGKGDPLYAQCEPDRRRCLFHRGCLPGTGPGTPRRCHPLERTKACVEPMPEERFERLVADGVTLVAATAEAPPGWTRDERGRVMQTSFDMDRRVWLGGRYAPTVGPGDRQAIGRAAIEAGLSAYVLGHDARHRYRFGVLTGELLLNPLEVDATVFRFDQSADNREPLFRLTTFWPQPRRHDGFLDVGWWTEVLGVSYRPRSSADDVHLRYVAIGPTFELWHDPSMARYVRLRVGGGWDDLILPGVGDGHRLAATPIGALESELPLDDDGFYRLGLSTRYEAPLVFEQGSAAPPTHRSRFSNELGFEMIVLAVNDQPVTVRLSAAGGYRDDVAAALAGWEMRAGAGLRVSLWAPGPDEEYRRRLAEKAAE